ncbi:MAG TPA: cyclic nucleotide-binding domain-containing protein, partial [Gammaproteobacteria bacterium]|nr:cyclic nucleotide-binding domain-containing protein [Gammaproteobacteria bacterium]
MDVKKQEDAIMDKKSIKAFLKEIELFFDFDDNEIDQIISLVEVIRYEAGSLLYETNAPRRYIYIIYEGEVQLFRTDSF